MIKSIDIKNKVKYLSLASNTNNLEIIRDFISNQCLSYGFDDKDTNSIVLAVDEACTNIIKHGYNFNTNNNIYLKVFSDDCYFIIQISDESTPFNPNQYKNLNLKEYISEFTPGGLGIYIIRNVMDVVNYYSGNNNNYNTLILKKTLCGQ